MSRSFPLVALLLALLLSGCATYGSGLNSTIQGLQNGDFAASEASLKKILSPTGNDSLLYYTELAVIKHLQGDFAGSNALLETAERIADDLETTRLSDALVTMMSNPRQGPYGGADFEKMFINYYKALNYFGLAQQAADQNGRLDALESAGVEARRLTIRLNDIASRKGTYMADAGDERTFGALMDIFNKVLRGNLVDLDSLRYRDDAMAHYLAAISFEMNNDFDDARISYQKAAQAYEKGYVKQYRLDDGMIAQAWFDTIRMMRRAGGYDSEWRALAKRKLSAEQQRELDNWTRDKAQLIVLEHKGLAPHRKEMNLLLSLNSAIKSMQLRPVMNPQDQNQMAWFYMLYADKGVLGVVTTYLDAVNLGLLSYGFTKTVFLGPLWDSAETLGLIDAIGSGLRVTVPYYDPVTPLGASTLAVNGQQLPLLKSSNPALMALQEQMTQASYDIQMAFSRAALKAITAQQLNQVSKEYGGLLAMVGKLAAQLTDAAETRNWLLLPQDIRIRRVALEAGEHQLQLTSDMPTGLQTQTQTVTLQAGEIHFWRVRTLPQLGHTALTPAKQLAQNAN